MFEANVARTPGSASTRRTMSSTRRSLASGSSRTLLPACRNAWTSAASCRSRCRTRRDSRRSGRTGAPDKRYECERNLGDHQRASEERFRHAVTPRECLPSACRADSRGRPAATGTTRTRSPCPPLSRRCRQPPSSRAPSARSTAPGSVGMADAISRVPIDCEQDPERDA